MGILNGGKPQECDLPNSPVVLGEVRMGESESGVLRGCQTLVAESASLGRDGVVGESDITFLRQRNGALYGLGAGVNNHD
jgi:hypothetical protein